MATRLAVPIEEYLTLSAAGAALGVKRAQVRQLCRSGRLDHVNTAYGRLVNPVSLAEYSVRRDQRRRTIRLPAERTEA